MKRKIAISVIVPLYKGKKYITRLFSMIQVARDLFIQEKNQLIELILVNDCPEEKICLDELKNRECDYYYIINNETNLGIHSSRIIGLRKARGEFIHFLDQDDLISQDYYLNQYLKIGNNDVIICNGKFRDSRVIIPDSFQADKIASKEAYFSSLEDIVSPGQALIRKKSIPNEWTENILHNNYCDDAFLWILMKNKDKKFAVNNDMLYVHVETGKNASQSWNITQNALFELMKVVQTNELIDRKLEQILVSCIEKKIDKHKLYENLENDLKRVERTPSLLKEYLSSHEYKKISLYGYGIIGKRFHYICKSLGVEISYSYDQNTLSTKDMIIYKMEENAPEVDIIIITPIQEKNAILQELRKRRKETIVGIDTLLKNVIKKV